MKKKILKWFNILVGAGLIVFLVAKLDFDKLQEILVNLDLGLAFLSLLLFGVFILMQSYRWYYLLSDYEITYTDMVRLFLIGIFFNNFLPGGIGGDGYKVYYLNRIKKGLGKAATLTILDRIAGMLVMLGILLTYLLLRWQQVKEMLSFNFSSNYLLKILIGIGILLGGALVLYLVLRGPYAKKIRQFIEQSKNALGKITKIQLFSLFVQAFLAHAIKSVSFILLLNSLGSDCDFFSMLFSLSVIGWLVVLPISIGGLGLREGALTVLLQNFGVEAPYAIAFSLASRFMIYFAALIGGLFFMKGDKKEISDS